MIETLNNLQKAISSKEEEIAKTKQLLRQLEEALTQLKKELGEAEDLAAQEAAKGFIKLNAQYFTYPCHYYGGADTSQKKWGETETIYVSAEEAYSLLKEREVYGPCGSGVIYSRA